MVRTGSEFVVLVINLLRHELLAGGYIHVGSATAEVLDEPGRAQAPQRALRARPQPHRGLQAPVSR